MMDGWIMDIRMTDGWIMDIRMTAGRMMNWMDDGWLDGRMMN